LPRSPSYSAALPIAYVALRILVVVNWLLGACILALLLYTFVNEPWTMRALEVTDYPKAQTVLNGMRAIAAVGLIAIPLNHIVLTRLLAMVGTVRSGDPFVAANAYRLRAIAWTLLSLQLLGLVIAAIVEAISTPEHPVDIEAGFSVNGWLAVLLTFILARVFAEGTLMREDLEGTV
jgi:Na+/melibiose symporter-like transporter